MSIVPYFAVPEKDGLPVVCSFEEGVLTPCWILDEALEAPYGRGTKQQGMKLLSLVNIEKRQFSRNAVSLISGGHKRGVQLTFCPFCASILQPALAEEITVTIAERAKGGAS